MFYQNFPGGVFGRGVDSIDAPSLIFFKPLIGLLLKYQVSQARSYCGYVPN